MKVRRLVDNDWSFGNGKANYLKDNDAVFQNVFTRLRSFKYDWFLDIDANIDWFNILSQRENKQTIIDEVKRVTLQTDGVTKINKLELLETGNRTVTILLNFDTIYKALNDLEFKL